MHKLKGEEVLGASACQTKKFKEDETKIKVKKKVSLQVLWLSPHLKNQHV